MRSILLLAALALPGGPRPPTPDPAPERPNVLLLCVDDLRPELGCYGVAHAHTPNIDALAARGRAFTRHYVQAPTCGASRYALLTGRLSVAGASRGNDALVRRAEALEGAPPSLPEVFRAAGYETVSIGKVSHHPGGRYGAGWNDPERVEMPGAWTHSEMPTGAWGTPQGTMHALADGHVRQRGVTPACESHDGDDASYPDGLTAARAAEELERLAAGDAPFLLAVGLIRPHLPFGAPARYMAPYRDAALPPTPHPTRPAGRTTWHQSGEFFGQYDHDGRDPREDAEYADLVRRHYLACVTYADALIGGLLAQLDALGLAQDTVVVLWGDHGWHLGEHAIWGKHALFEESLRAPLIVASPVVEQPGVSSSAVVSSVDLFPTLCALARVAPPADLDGRALLPQLADPAAPGRPAVSYRGGAETLRTERWRLVRHVKDGETVFVELYDHDSDAGETQNFAERDPERVEALLAELAARLR